MSMLFTKVDEQVSVPGHEVTYSLKMQPSKAFVYNLVGKIKTFVMIDMPIWKWEITQGLKALENDL